MFKKTEIYNTAKSVHSFIVDNDEKFIPTSINSNKRHKPNRKE